MKKLLLCFALVLLSGAAVRAQDFEIKRYDLNAQINLDAHTVEVRARLRMVNLSSKDLLDRILLAGADKPRLSFFLNNKAKVAAMTINSAEAPVRAVEEPRTNLLLVSTEITSAIASAPEFDVECVYTIPSVERSTSLHISAGETFLLPASFWVPVKHTPYADHGADTAPFALTVTAPAGMKVVSSGLRKSETSFEQSGAGQPFFIVGDYDVTVRGGDAPLVEVYAPRGLDQIGQRQAARLADEAARIMAYYARYFGLPPSAPLRVMATQARGLALSLTEAMTVDDSFFRRDALDLGTIELLAGTAAKAWIDGRVLLRGRGTGMLRDALPIYLAAQYLGERFGAAQREAAFERYRRAYAPLARGSDAPLLMQSPIDRNYVTSIYNKGALVWRLIEKRIGRPAFDALLRQSLDRQRVDVLTLTEWRASLCAASRCASIKGNLMAGSDRKEIADLFAQWIETVVLPDIAIGQPQTTASGVESTVANFGNGDFPVEVLALTTTGEQLRRTVLVKAGEFGAVSFPAGTQIKTIEADPEKIYLQKDYTNDAFPRPPSAADLYGQAALAFGKNEFAAAEAKAREALSVEADSLALQALLGRALLGQNKREEASRIFNAVLKSEALPIQAFGWAHLGLGELALQQNAFAQAAAHFRYAAAAEMDPATTLAARDGALRAERGANAVKIAEEARGFLQQLDAAILQGSSAVMPLIEQGNLKRFAQSFISVKPASWTTEVLRTETWDANRLAVDVLIKAKISGKDYAGPALYVLNRAGGKLLLSEVPIFDVK
jgi:hypothetical protein